MKHPRSFDNLLAPQPRSPLADASHPPLSFDAWIRDVQQLAPDAIGRLTAFVSQLLTPRLTGLRADQRTRMLWNVIARVIDRAREVALDGPRALLELIEREAAACGLDGHACEPTGSGWIERLARLLPQLDGLERRVLEGLYLDSQRPAILAERLGVTPLELDEARRRGLSQLRLRLAGADC